MGKLKATVGDTPAGTPFLTPSAFRERLTIDQSGRPVLFTPAPFQESDFVAADPAWMFVAGRTDTEPAFRRFFLERGRGSSKSFDISCMATWCLAFANGPVRGVVAAGDQQQADLIRSSIDRLIKLNSWLAGILTVQADRVVNTASGAELIIISSDVATSFGLLIDFCICDELANWKEQSQPLWESLFSAVGKRSNAIMIVITNSGFVESWQWPLREQVRQDPDWLFRRLEGFAPWIGEKQIDGQRRTLPPMVFSRLWENQWSTGSGDALQPGDIDASVSLPGPMAGPEPGWNYFVGVDAAFSKDNAAAVLVAKHHTGILRVGRVLCWRPPGGGKASDPLIGKIDMDQVRESLMGLHRLFNRPLFYFDPQPGQDLAQAIAKMGARAELIRFVGINLQDMAAATLEAFSGGKIAMWKDDGLLSDLRKLKLKDSPSGWRLWAPRTSAGHADRAVALSLALLAARRTTVVPTSTESPFAFGRGFGAGDFEQAYGPMAAAQRGIIRSFTDPETGRPRLTGSYEADDRPFFLR
jgi:hypothetical protein